MKSDLRLEESEHIARLIEDNDDAETVLAIVMDRAAATVDSALWLLEAKSLDDQAKGVRMLRDDISILLSWLPYDERWTDR